MGKPLPTGGLRLPEGKFCGIKVNDIKNIANAMKDAVVIIGVTEKYRKEILDNLKLLGFENIVIPEAKGQTK